MCLHKWYCGDRSCNICYKHWISFYMSLQFATTVGSPFICLFPLKTNTSLINSSFSRWIHKQPVTVSWHRKLCLIWGHQGRATLSCESPTGRFEISNSFPIAFYGTFDITRNSFCSLGEDILLVIYRVRLSDLDVVQSKKAWWWYSWNVWLKVYGKDKRYLNHF